jgi:hypothetical protein
MTQIVKLMTQIDRKTVVKLMTQIDRKTVVFITRQLYAYRIWNNILHTFNIISSKLNRHCKRCDGRSTK